MIGRLVFMVNDLISRTALLLDMKEDWGARNHSDNGRTCYRRRGGYTLGQKDRS